jgi:hypothetical protein
MACEKQNYEDIQIVNNLPIRLGKFLIIGTWLSKLICWSELESSVIQVLSAPVTALLMEKVLKYAYDLLTTWITLNEYRHCEVQKNYLVFHTSSGGMELLQPRGRLQIREMSGSYKGVRLASGQDIFSQKLVLDPSSTLPSPPASQSDLLHGSY